MKLHNRLIKASFWNDPDLLQWPRDKRWFYEGLVQLADDSGCLEDSPFAFKVHLFPSPLDADITVEVVASWIGELVDQRKLVRYEAQGKSCLFIVNFHRHQVLRNSPPPSVPLPPWVTWQPFSSNSRSGKYIVSEELLTQCLQRAYGSLTQCLQSASNQNHEPEPEPEPEPEISSCSDEHEGDASVPAASRADPVESGSGPLVQEKKPPKPPPKPLHPPPLEPELEKTLALFGAKRFKTPGQLEAYRFLLRDVGAERFLDAVKWAASTGLGLNNFQSIATAARRAPPDRQPHKPPGGNGSARAGTQQEPVRDASIYRNPDGSPKSIDEFFAEVGSESV